MTHVLFRLLQSYISSENSEDLQMKSKTALKKILQKCVYLPSLEPLLHDAPSNILKHVVAQYSKVLSQNNTSLPSQNNTSPPRNPLPLPRQPR